MAGARVMNNDCVVANRQCPSEIDPYHVISSFGNSRFFGAVLVA